MEYPEIVTDIEELTKPCQEFKFINPPFDPSQFAKELVETMFHYNGLGLAANQLGIQYKIFAMRGDPHNFVCFNPRIAMPSSERVLLEESCLSFPGLTVKVKRPQHVRVRFAGPDGQVRTHLFTGMTARIFQHELDHVEGKLFFEGTNRFHLEHAVKNTKYKSMGLLKYAKKT